MYLCFGMVSVDLEKLEFKVEMWDVLGISLIGLLQL